MKTRQEWIEHFVKLPSGDRVSKAIDEIMAIQRDLLVARRTVALFSSMISSGEAHTETSLDMLEKAMGTKK